MAGQGITVDYHDMQRDMTDVFLDALRQQMMAIGEMAVNEARSKNKTNDWHDVTGNLRSSIGYVLLEDGHTIVDGRPQAFPSEGNSGAEGVAQGNALLARLKGQYPRGLVLIICAGMNYASIVESRGKNVLTSAEQKAEVAVEKLLKDLRA